MRRPLVILLAAFDAAVSFAVGTFLILVPLTLTWVFAFGAAGDWGLLWPVTAMIWQFGHLVPIELALSPAVAGATGIDPDAAHFTLSLAPLALGLFTFIFATRSGARAARAFVWQLGVLSGTATMALLAWVAVLTSGIQDAKVDATWAVVAPALIYFVGAIAGAVATAWRNGDRSSIDALKRALARREGWADVPAHIVRGGAIAVTALVGVASVMFALTVFFNASEIVGLYEKLHVDVLGAVLITLGQLAYLPTLIIWTVAWLAGPGFAVGAGTAVTPAGTELGVVPAIPIFAALPEDTSMWALVVVILPVVAGAFAAWAVRSRMVATTGDLSIGARVTITLGIAAVAAVFGAVAGAAASGSIGPERLAVMGPDAGMLALALGSEVLIGAAIILLTPRNREELAAERGRVSFQD